MEVSASLLKIFLKELPTPLIDSAFCAGLGKLPGSYDLLSRENRTNGIKPSGKQIPQIVRLKFWKLSGQNSRRLTAISRISWLCCNIFLNSSTKLPATPTRIAWQLTIWRSCWHQIWYDLATTTTHLQMFCLLRQTSRKPWQRQPRTWKKWIWAWLLCRYSLPIISRYSRQNQHRFCLAAFIFLVFLFQAYYRLIVIFVLPCVILSCPTDVKAAPAARSCQHLSFHQAMY